MSSSELMTLVLPSLFVAIAVTSLFVLRGREQKPIPLLQVQADRLGDSVRSRALGFYVYLEFEHCGIRARLRCRRGSKANMESDESLTQRSPSTIVSAELEAPASLKLNVRNDDARTAINRALGVESLETGNADFDKHFHMQSNDETFALEFMDSNLQRQMLTVTKTLKWPPRLSLDLSELELRTDYILKDSAEFEALTDCFIAMLERANSMQLALRAG